MKIKKEHYDYMAKTLFAFCEENKIKILNHIAYVRKEGKYKDLRTRIYWDLCRAASLSQYLCDEIYPYADDTHVFTALKHLLGKVEWLNAEIIKKQP